jgi:hypothetical protein
VELVPPSRPQKTPAYPRNVRLIQVTSRPSMPMGAKVASTRSRRSYDIDAGVTKS